MAVFSPPLAPATALLRPVDMQMSGKFWVQTSIYPTPTKVVLFIFSFFRSYRTLYFLLMFILIIFISELLKFRNGSSF